MTLPGVVFWRILLVVLMAGVALLSVASITPDAIPGNVLTRFIATLLFGDVTHADKVGHFIAYTVLGGAAFAAQIVRRALWFAPLLIALYGGVLEGVQYLLPHRTADVIDAAVNGAGAAAGFFASAALRQFILKA